MKENNGLTPLNWVLSIAGILVLSCLVILPPVFKIAFKEKEKTSDDPKVVVQHMTCVKNHYPVEKHFESDTIKFTYVANKINKYSYVKEIVFDDTESFDKYKEEYGKLSTAYSLIKTGIEHKLNIDNSTLKIVSSEEFNLGSFQPTSVTIPGDNEPTKVDSEYTREDSVSDIKTELINSGYSCTSK